MTGQEIVKKWDRLASKRSTWVNHWQECADVCLSGNQSIATSFEPGQKNTTTNYDTTAITANQDMAAGIFSYLFSGRWFSLKATEGHLNERADVKHWMARATELLHEQLATSNFGIAMIEHLMYLGVFGTGCMYPARGKKSLLNFTNYFIGNFCIEENSDGSIDTLCRYFPLTARQALQEFGRENLSAEILKAASDDKTADKEFHFVHIVYPRKDRDPDKLDNLNMAYASEYVEYNTKHKISVSGWQTMKFIVDRFYKYSGEVYGRSSAMSVLPDIKMVSTMQKDNLVAVQKAQNPPILMPNDGSAGPAITRPGGITYFNPGISQDNRPQVFYNGSDIRSAAEEIANTRAIIRKAFYNDLFELLDSLGDKTNRTATEIIKRIEEKLLRLTPVSGRLQAELATPLIEQCVNIMLEAGAFGPLPADVDSYQIQYSSKLALTLKRLEIQAMADTLAFIAPMAETSPDILDNYDFDKIARGVAENNGVPTEWMRPIEDVMAIRDQRTQQAAAQQQLETGAVMADAAGKNTKAIEKGSLTDRALEAVAA